MQPPHTQVSNLQLLVLDVLALLFIVCQHMLLEVNAVDFLQTQSVCNCQVPLYSVGTTGYYDEVCKILPGLEDCILSNKHFHSYL